MLCDVVNNADLGDRNPRDVVPVHLGSHQGCYPREHRRHVVVHDGIGRIPGHGGFQFCKRRALNADECVPPGSLEHVRNAFAEFIDAAPGFPVRHKENLLLHVVVPAVLM